MKTASAIFLAQFSAITENLYNMKSPIWHISVSKQIVGNVNFGVSNMVKIVILAFFSFPISEFLRGVVFC